MDQSGESRSLTLFLSAGEVSGDYQAAHLARLLSELYPGVKLTGYGGDHMRAAGVEILCDSAAWGYVGLEESLRFRPDMRRARTQFAEMLKAEKPDLVILVDGEAFNERLVAVLRREGIRFVHYFVPQVWFWGRWRARKIAVEAALIIPAFPKELEIFRESGARTEWFGHPLLDLIPEVKLAPEPTPEDDTRPVALLPGSRVQEIETLGPTLIEAAKRLQRDRPGLRFVLPVAAKHLECSIRKLVADAGMDEHVEIREGWTGIGAAGCRLALVASGTATLETALACVPMIAFYRVRRLTYFAARLLVKTRFVAMPNILLNERVVPELLQEAFTVEALVAEASALLGDPQRIEEMRRNLARIPAVLGGRGAIGRAARAIIDLALEVPTVAGPEPSLPERPR
jgi:lipid-A-disaccharide synthase